MSSNMWELSNEDWVGAADEALGFVKDPDARGLILYRFEDQYLPALRKARNPDQLWRAWNAFHYYLTARESRRKMFSLSEDEADNVISILTDILNLPPYSAS